MIRVLALGAGRVRRQAILKSRPSQAFSKVLSIGTYTVDILRALTFQNSYALFCSILTAGFALSDTMLAGIPTALPHVPSRSTTLDCHVKKFCTAWAFISFYN